MKACSRHTQKSESLIKEIAKNLSQRDQHTYTIGKLIDQLIAHEGGLRYGKHTIEKIAKHRMIQRSSKQIRRYWDYYRVFHQYGKLVRDVPASYVYEIARILDAEKSEKETRRLVAEYANYYRNCKAQKITLGVDEFRAKVTAAIEDTASGTAPTKTVTPGSATKPRKSSKTAIGNLLSYDEAGLNGMGDYLVNLSAPEHMAKRNWSMALLRNEAKRIQDSWVRLVSYMIEHDAEDNARELIEQLQEQLRRLSATATQRAEAA